MDKFAVDLLWLRPGGVGGTEVVARNLFDGMKMLEEEFHAVLIASTDNADTLRHYAEEDDRFEILTAPIASAGIMKRIIWQNLHLNAFLRKHGFRYCFSPVYDRPFFNGGIHYITTIHDIQAYHYPEYHPFHEVVYSKMAWKTDRDRSDANIVISDFVAEDIVKVYGFDRRRMKTIYDPVILNPEEQSDFGPLAEKFHVTDRGYYYTVGQLIPHKNMETLLRVMKRIADGKDRSRSMAESGSGAEPDPAKMAGTDQDGSYYARKLLITGINGNAAETIRKKIGEMGLEENVILTGYLGVPDRNALYAHAKMFLFPSVFEGFGLPPIEAMMMGTPVVATKCACIPEVTQNLAEYVDDPYDTDDWLRHMKNPVNRCRELDTSRYDQKKIAGEYVGYLKEVWKLQ